MEILHLSDTHNKHRQLGNMPAADIIIHSGDVSFAGTTKEVDDFIDWFGSLSYQYKIFIAGNHDYALEGKAAERIQQYLPENCFYLCDNGVKINGIQFWGIPFFFSPEDTRLDLRSTELIPDNTDILISHRPPYGILDESNNRKYGCNGLLEAVSRISPTYHLFGHIHDAYGIEKQNHTTFVNAAVVDPTYKLVNNPILFLI